MTDVEQQLSTARLPCHVGLAAVAIWCAVACGPRASDDYDGPYPVDDLLEDIDALDAHYCECAIAVSPEPPNTVEECNDAVPPVWAPGTPRRQCLAEVGHHDEWWDNDAVPCFIEGAAAADAMLCDYVEQHDVRPDFAPKGPLCSEEADRFWDAVIVCYDDLIGVSGGDSSG